MHLSSLLKHWAIYSHTMPIKATIPWPIMVEDNSDAALSLSTMLVRASGLHSYASPWSKPSTFMFPWKVLRVISHYKQKPETAPREILPWRHNTSHHSDFYISVIPATDSDKLTPLPGRGKEHSPVPTFLANWQTKLINPHFLMPFVDPPHTPTPTPYQNSWLKV